jgi:crotonobetaine/carnitine-CoA ligase
VRERSLRAALEARVEAHPERLALRFGEQCWTYAELLAEVERTASALRLAGAGPGGRVALMLENCPDFVACWLATAWLGATLVPLNVKLRGELLGYQLGHAEPDVALVGGAQLEAFQAAERPADSRTVLVGSEAAPPGWLLLDGLRAEAPGGAPPIVDQTPESLALIMYTSGTTGRPKGVMIPRQAQLHHGLNYRELLGIGPEETCYTYLPLYHVTAMGSTLGSLLAGASVALEAGFNPFGFWERTRRYGAVVFTFVGSILPALYHRPERPDDADNPVRRAVGAATPTWLWRAFERRFGLEVVETYGQTELAALWLGPPEAAEHSPERERGGRRGERRPPRLRSGLGQRLSECVSAGFAVVPHSSDHARHAKVGTVGIPAGDRFDVRIVGPDGQELGSEERGEIAIRPKDRLDMMLGYYRDPEATAAALRPDGWYYTGDLGVRDADGYVAYAGRLKDCIRRRGEMIAAYEVERVVNAHPLVLESAAVAVPAEHGEEEIKLCVVPRQPGALEARAVWEHCRRELPAFMVPRWIHLRVSLPKTATERVRKPALVAEGVAECWQAGAGALRDSDAESR